MIKQKFAIMTIVVFWTAAVVGAFAAGERLLAETNLEYMGAFRVPYL